VKVKEMENANIQPVQLSDKCPSGQEWDPRVNKCVSCPGGKIRSKGKGQGKGYGKGKGPIGRMG